MLTEDKITEIFVIADEFCKVFNAMLRRRGLSKIRWSHIRVGNAFPLNLYLTRHIRFERGSPSPSTTYPNRDLEPERTKSWEAGLEARLWMDKIRLNVSFYKTSTYNQVFKAPMSSGSGYEAVYLNGGQVDNQGYWAFSQNQPAFWTG